MVYSGESALYTKTRMANLEAAQSNGIRRMLRIPFFKRISNKELRLKAQVPTVESYLLQKRLKWWGCIKRLSNQNPDHALPQVVFGHGGKDKDKGSKLLAIDDLNKWISAAQNAGQLDWATILEKPPPDAPEQKHLEWNYRANSLRKLTCDYIDANDIRKEELLEEYLNFPKIWGDITKVVYKYQTDEEMLNHGKRRMGTTQFQHTCVVCNKKYQNEKGLQQHQIMVHRPRTGKSKQQLKKEERTKKIEAKKQPHPVQTVECKICQPNLIFKTVPAARTHWARKHKN